MTSSYLRAAATALAVTFGAVAALNALVDPYATLGRARIPGFNDPKARPESDILQFKVFNAIAAKPNALIIGNSRAEIGLDPDHPAWAQRSLKAYNLAVPGGTLATSLEALKTMCSAARYRRLLIALDFQDFLVAAGDRPVSPDALPDVRPKRLQPDAFDFLRSVLTSAATTDSIRTIRVQFQQYPAIVTGAGFNPLYDYVPVARESGYHPLFQQRLQENARNYLRKPKTVRPSAGGDSPAVARLRLMVREARACADRVDFLTYPYHSQMLLLFGEAGLWPAFEDWKRLLTTVVEQERADAPAAQHVRLLDFASFSVAARQPPPLPGEPKRDSAWYWESGHFKKELGDELLALVLNETMAKVGGPLMMVELKPAIIDGWLVIVADQEAEFRRLRPKDVVVVRQAVRASLGS